MATCCSYSSQQNRIYKRLSLSLSLSLSLCFWALSDMVIWALFKCHQPPSLVHGGHTSKRSGGLCFSSALTWSLWDALRKSKPFSRSYDFAAKPNDRATGASLGGLKTSATKNGGEQASTQLVGRGNENRFEISWHDGEGSHSTGFLAKCGLFFHL